MRRLMVLLIAAVFWPPWRPLKGRTMLRHCQSYSEAQRPTWAFEREFERIIAEERYVQQVRDYDVSRRMARSSQRRLECAVHVGVGRAIADDGEDRPQLLTVRSCLIARSGWSDFFPARTQAPP